MTYTTQTLADVLKPRAAAAQPRCVPPVQVAHGSIQDDLINRAAAQVRSIYNRNQRRVSYDACAPEFFFDACWDTLTVALEVEQAVSDDMTAAITGAIFSRAGWFGSLLRPTTLDGQVQMQTAAIDAARLARPFFAKQASLV
jgi:hypothetical protein